ncbi:hypothetical protein VTH82DRAFT_3308 [Thermothelomyces myriococcoides]
MTMNPRRVIRVREAAPADLEAILDVYFSAFDDNAMNQLIYPRGATPACREKFGLSIFPQRPAGNNAKGKRETLVCVAEAFPDGESTEGPGEIIAFAKWQLQREPLPEDEWKNEEFKATAEAWGEDCDLAFVDAFIGGMNRVQRDNAKGEAALYLSLLGCTPAYQRCGAGSALLEWGVNLADRLGLPSRLEASPAGYRLYKKFGYEDMAVLDLEITEGWGKAKPPDSDWGENNAVDLAGPLPVGAQRTVIMRRPPRSTTV